MAEKDVRRVFEPVSTKTKLVCNLSLMCFLQFGDIKRVNLASDEEGHCRGFAFVEFLEEVSLTGREGFGCSLTRLISGR